MEEKLIRVEGLVQGVGYRAFAQAEAVSLGLAGFARNLPDGRVEVLVQGDGPTIEAFIERLRQGPRMAAVGDVVVVNRAPGPPCAAFEVR